MVSIAFTELKVWKVHPDVRGRIDIGGGFGGVELGMKFSITPDPSYPYQTDVQIAILDKNNKLIYTLVQGSRKYSMSKKGGGEVLYASIPAVRMVDGKPVDLSEVSVNAWITGGTIIRRYNIFSTTGAIEKNRISNIASRKISLAHLIKKKAQVAI